MTTHPDVDETVDQSWENRRLILAALAPRSTSRPARRSMPVPDADLAEPAAGSDTKPRRRARKSGRSRRPTTVAVGGGVKRLYRALPSEHRLRNSIIAAASLVLIGSLLSGLNYLSSDVTSSATTTSVAAPPSSKIKAAPVRTSSILTDIKAVDKCPRDDHYAEAKLAFDSDAKTAWTCTRVKNQDGQIIQVDFGRQVCLAKVRMIGGFDAYATDNTDLWSQHRLVTKLEAWFPKELHRAPAVITTDGVRDWRSVDISPPATVSMILLRVAETSEPPPPATGAPDTADDANDPDKVSTVAISEVQFLGYDLTGDGCQARS